MNEDQIAFWNSAHAQKWVTFQEGLDAIHFAPLQLLLDRAAPANGESVLDVGCGAGASTIALASRVGRKGRAIGLDISQPLIDHARHCAEASEIDNVEFVPNKVVTETQIARLVGATPLQVDLTLVRIGSHMGKNTPEDHLIAFYQTWEEVKNRKFDGFIITGAPVETLPFEDVTYWRELTRIFDWTETNVHSTFLICWGAMAAAWHFHQIPKYTFNEKVFGVFRHHNLNPASPYLAGFSDDFSVSVSRWTEVRRADICPEMGLEVLMESDETGLCLIAEERCNRLYMFNHIEYDSTTLAEEYFRDIKAGTMIKAPHGYFPGDDPARKPVNRWRSHAFLLFGNWINCTYQTAPFDLAEIGKGRTKARPASGT